MYQELVIEQVRELSAWLALTPSSDRGKVALIEPAHLLNQAAANALLKTLEEPVPGRYVLLVTDQPARLPATIRSRCQRFELKLPVRDEALGLAARTR
jgi:DNA polymerase-3 subunit delta'